MTNVSLRFYPHVRGPSFYLLREGVLLAPYTVVFLAAVVLMFSLLSGWMLWASAACMFSVHVYLTTDLLLPHWRKAEVMGYGLEQFGNEVRFVGYSSRRRWRSAITATIQRVEEHAGGVHVVLVEGAPLGLDHLSKHAQGVFVRAYGAMAAGARRSAVLALDRDIKQRFLRAARYDDGPRRPYGRLQTALVLAMTLPELWAALHLAAWIRPMVLGWAGA